MSQAEQKIVQYLSEAHASEVGLVRELQTQIAMTPRGSYRTALETHLRETRDHAKRVKERLNTLGQGDSALQMAVGLAESAVSQILAFGKAPLALVRGSTGEEKILKNAKDACATEALEIATYTAIEHLARSAGDEITAQLATKIRADEQRMLERIMREIPKLAAVIVGAERDSSYDITETGAADLVREVADAGKQTVRSAQGRARGQEPWPGYDELNVEEIRAALSGSDEARLGEVRSYERSHKNRAGVIQASERQTAHA